MLYMRKYRTLSLSHTLCVCPSSFFECVGIKYLRALDTLMDTVKEEQARAREISRTQEGLGLVLEVRACFYACSRQLALTDMLDWHRVVSCVLLTHCVLWLLLWHFVFVCLGACTHGAGELQQEVHVHPPISLLFFMFLKTAFPGCATTRCKGTRQAVKIISPTRPFSQATPTTPTMPTRSPTGSINQSVKRTPITLTSDFSAFIVYLT
ncbi:hypothetical protein EDC04DRAFT_2629803 [Pisolithus marmoratus]|nr:hypothetical protein EDC04DRAFT_2629803 [Pisolithus marmoratus]